MKNRFYTVMIVPEKTSSIRKFVIPTWLFKTTTLGGILLLGFLYILATNYYLVMNQVSENKALKLENRKLKQDLQIVQNQMGLAEQTLDRLQTLATRLKVLLEVEQNGLYSEQPASPLPLPSPQPSPALSTPSSSSLSLEQRLASIIQAGSTMELTLQNQYENLHDKKAFLAALPTRQPAVGYFTSGFGVRTSPYGDRIKMHEGLDIANHVGTPVHATANGEIIFAHSKIGYGLTLIINHGYGIETWYGHLKKLLVSTGKRVKRGDKIALLGHSGRATGPHVHYEIRIHGYPVDPMSYIFEPFPMEGGMLN